MASALDPPAARGYEDSQTRFEDYNVGGQNFIRRLNKKTYTLVDGPNSGNTVTYWAQEVATAGASGGTTTVVGADTPADAHPNPTTAVIVSAWPEIRDNGATTSSQMRAGSPTADPGNVGVLAAQMHITGGSNIVRLASGNQPDANNGQQSAGSALMAFNGSTWDRLRTATSFVDAQAALGLLATGTQVFNGATWDRVRSGTALGSVLVNNPTAANLLATATIANDQGLVAGTLATHGVPSAATFVTAATTSTANTAATATLAGVSAKTTFISGFQVTFSAGTATGSGEVTITGLATTLRYQVWNGASANGTVLTVNFPYPIPASAANTAIVVNTPAGGTAAISSTSVQGFQL